jgi:hypothetical protein
MTYVNNRKNFRSGGHRNGTDGTLERFSTLRQFAGEFFIRRRIAATAEAPAGDGDGGRPNDRIFF